MPQAPTASPEKLDAFLDAVGTRLNQLQATVADLVERSAHSEGGGQRPIGMPAAPVATGDSDVDAASRTLVLAQRTADSLLAEARDEAAKLVADAQAASEKMMSEARAAADAELGVQRAKLTAEQAHWDDLKAKLSESFTALDGQLDNYVANLTMTHESVKVVLKGFDIPAEIVVPDEVIAPEAVPAESDAPIDEGAAFEAPAEAPSEPMFGTPEPPTGEQPGEAEPANSMFGPRTTPLFSGQSTGWNNEGGESAAPPMPEPPPAPSRRPGFFGQ